MSSDMQNIKKYQCIFMGTPYISVPFLKKLHQIEKVVLVITREDKPKGRGHKISPPPVKEIASELNIPVWQPSSLKNQESVNYIKKFKPDLIVVVAYGKILPKAILDIPTVAPLNVHFSLLPKYRGAAPVQWALIQGETETGVTIMKMNEKMDAGDILLYEKVKIEPDDTTESLYDKLIPIGLHLLERTLQLLKNRKANFKPQEENMATYAPMLKKEDGKLNWRMSAQEVYNRIRGLRPWPCAFTYLKGKMLKIFSSSVIESSTHYSTPGKVKIINRKVCVLCGKGILQLGDIQIEGRKTTDAVNLLNGRVIKEGDLLE